MILVELIKTGKVVRVTRNEAHGLIDSGAGKLVKGYKAKPLMPDGATVDSDMPKVQKGKRGYSIK